ncbi:MAG TPA: hypothetical protein VEZ46_02545 [Mycobacteriales bacterium]|nr:hypothetical protein [Mycobacteriales bacterium]
MNIDDRLKEAFQAKAVTAQTSPEAFELIRDRVRAGRRIRLLQVAGAGIAVPAMVVAAIALAGNSPTRVSPSPRPEGSGTATSVATPSGTPAETPATSAPTPTPSATTTPDVTPTPRVSGTPKATGAVVPSPTPDPAGPTTGAGEPAPYASAIAVARPGGKVELVSADGRTIQEVVTLEGREIHGIEWSPDRTQLYVSSLQARSEDFCPQTVLVDLSDRKVEQLGRWGEVAFSSDGKTLAAFVTSEGCQIASLLVRELGTGAETVIQAGDNAEWDSLSSLAWVPGVNRLVFVQHGLGDSSVIRLLDLAKPTPLADAAPLGPQGLGAGELVSSVTYSGGRLLAGTRCCLGPTEYMRIIERGSSSGDATELYRNDGDEFVASNLDTSPDGKRVVFTSFGDGSAAWIWTVDGSDAPRKLVNGAVAAAW